MGEVARSAVSYDLRKVDWDRLVKQSNRHLGLRFSAFDIMSLLNFQSNSLIHSVLTKVSAYKQRPKELTLTQVINLEKGSESGIL